MFEGAGWREKARLLCEGWCNMQRAILPSPMGRGWRGKAEPGEEVRAIDSPHPLTPTLSPWERERPELVEAHGLVRRIARRSDGAALVEFTLIFPILIMMFLGLVEFGEAFAVSRKLTNGASTVSDLVAQVPSVSASELDDIARVAEEIIKPYRTANLGLVITSVRADGDNATTVAWSYAHGTGATARAQGSAFAAPAGLTEANSSVIVAETVYQFTPIAGMFLTGTIELSGVAYFRPRVSRSVVFED
jgi:Flp pilus assembly protein TadG